MEVGVHMNLVGAQQGHKQRRNHTDIVAKILTESINGISKTRIVSKCNLNFGLVGGYIEFAIKRNLLEAIQFHDKVLYKTTDAGLYALQAIRIAEKIMAPGPDNEDLAIAKPLQLDSLEAGKTRFSNVDSAALLPFGTISNLCKYRKEKTCQFDLPGHPCEANACTLLTSLDVAKINRVELLHEYFTLFQQA